MSWLLNRAMLAIFLTLVGAGVGAVVGDMVDARQLGPAIGAAMAVADLGDWSTACARCT